MPTTPMTYTELDQHILKKFRPLIRKQATYFSHAMEEDDVKQIARLMIYSKWEDPEYATPAQQNQLGEEVRAVALSRMETYIAKNLKNRTIDAANRQYATIRVPDRKRSRYNRIQRSAQKQQIPARDHCESMGMSHEEFDRITHAVAETLHLDPYDHDPYELHSAADAMLAYTDETWDELVRSLNKQLVDEAREALTIEEDFLIETYYYTLPQHDSSIDSACQAMNEAHKPSGKRYTPGYCRTLYAHAMLKMRHVLAPHLLDQQ